MNIDVNISIKITKDNIDKLNKTIKSHYNTFGICVNCYELKETDLNRYIRLYYVIGSYYVHLCLCIDNDFYNSTIVEDIEYFRKKVSYEKRKRISNYIK